MDFLPDIRTRVPWSSENSLLVDEVQTEFSEFSNDNQVLKSFVSNALKSKYDSYLSSVNELKKQNIIESKIIMSKMKECYDKIIDSTKLASQQKLILDVSISPIRIFSGYEKPSLDEWIKLNSELFEIVNYLVTEMRKKGYKPEIKLSGYSYDDEAGRGDLWYHGGNELIIKCDMNV